jgi:WD40 repeat protein
VFRDATDLAADPSLWNTIRSALDQSEYLIVLLSPGAAASPWIDREIQHWLATRSAGRIVLVVTRWAADQPDALQNLSRFAWSGSDVPVALRAAFTDEPRPVDARWTRHGAKLSVENPLFQETVAEIAAPILGRSKADLVGEHLRQRRLFRRTAVGVAALLTALLVFGGLSTSRAAERGRFATSRAIAARAQDVMKTEYDVALMLSAEALAVHSTPEARAGLLTVLAYHPEIQRYFRVDSADLTAVDLSEDGKRIAAGTRDGRLILWDESGDTPTKEFHRFGGAVSQVVFAAVGDRLAVAAGSPPEIAVFDLRSGKVLWRASNLLNGSALGAMVFDARGDLLALGGLNGTLKIVTAATGKEISSTPMLHPGGVRSLALHPTSVFLASGGWDGAVRIWEPRSSREVRRLLPTGRLGVESPPCPERRPACLFTRLGWRDNNPVAGLAFSPDGKFLESYTADSLGGRVVLWESASGRRLQDVRAPNIPSGFLDMASDGRIFAFEDDRDLILWDARLGKISSLEWLHPSLIMDVGFSARTGRVVTLGGNQVIVVDAIDIRSLARPLSDRLEPAPKSKVFLSPDASHLAYADSAGAIWVRSVAKDSALLGPLVGHDQIATDIAFSPDGKTMASAADDSVVIVWDLRTGEALFRLASHPQGTMAVAFSPDGALLAAAGSAHSGASFNPRTGERFEPAGAQWQLLLWDAASGKRRGSPWPLPDHGPPWDLQFSPDGRILAIGAGEATTLWNPDTRQLIGEPIRDAGLTKSLAFARDGHLAASSGGVIRILQPLDQGRSVRLAAPFSAITHTVALSPDGQTLAIGGDDGNLFLWDGSSGTQLGPALRIPGRTWDALVFQENGLTLIAAGANGVVAWDLDPASWVRRACAVANRTLTQQEWNQYLSSVGTYRPQCRK